MSCLDVMYHQSYGAHYLPASQAAAAAYKAAYYGHHQRKPSAYSKVQECVEQQMHQQQQQQQLQQSRASGMLPREQGLRRASLAPGSRCSISASASGGGGGGGGGSPGDCIMTKDSSGQPAEAEYLSARCVLFSYFQGSIGDVVDEHFSRALSQSGAFSREAKPVLRVTQQQPPAPLPGASWKDGASLSEGSIMNMWGSGGGGGGGSYPSQAGPCLPPASIAVHPDFPCAGSPLPFNPADGALWPGHALSPAGLPDPHSSWPYGLAAAGQGAAAAAAAAAVGSGYPQLHDLYPHHPAAVHHGHHPHHPGHHAAAAAHRFPHGHVLHPFPAHGPAAALDHPRFGPLLLPGVRQRGSGAGGHGASPPPPPPPPPALGEGVKTEMDPGVGVTVAAGGAALPASWSPAALHGALEVYESGLDQEKAKASAWF